MESELGIERVNLRTACQQLHIPVGHFIKHLYCQFDVTGLGVGVRQRLGHEHGRG